MNHQAELQILIHFLFLRQKFFPLHCAFNLTFNPLEDHSNICLSAFTRLKPFRIKTSLYKLKMASKGLLHTLGLTPIIGTPIIGNVGKVDSNV